MNIRKILVSAFAWVLLAGLVYAQQPGRNPAVPGKEREPGILVAAVVLDSPAEKAGMKRGDILLSLDGKTVNSVSELRELLLGYKAGQDVKLALQRGTAQVIVSLKLEDRIGKPLIGIVEANLRGFGGPEPVGPGRIEMRHRPGPDGFEGFGDRRPDLQPSILVQEVAAGSPAAKAGIQQGDIIVAIDGIRLPDLTGVIAGKKSGDTVKIDYLRPSESATQGANKTAQVILSSKDGKPWLGISGEVVDAGQRAGMDGPAPIPFGGPKPPSTNAPFDGI